VNFKEMHRFAFLLLGVTTSAGVCAGAIEDNLNRSTTVPASLPVDARCREWTAAPIQYVDSKVSIDVGKLATEAVANVLASRPGGQMARPNLHPCSQSAPVVRPEKNGPAWRGGAEPVD
jgi:hypothetical protein